MAYPKPLSEKSIERMYLQAGLSVESRVFLHKLFTACSNLYGVISVRSIWDLYRKMQDTAPKLRRKDVIAFSAITRREVQSYYVFELSELFSAEKNFDLDRLVVNRALVGAGYGKYNRFYSLMDELRDVPFYLPEDILAYADPVMESQEKALLKFLGNLKVTAEMSMPKYGKPYPCANKGKRLKEFSFMNRDESIFVEYEKKRPAVQTALIEEYSGTEAEKILRQQNLYHHIGWLDPATMFQIMLDELMEVGVELSERQLERLLELTRDQYNNKHLWYLCGWSPVDLADVTGPPTAISFGPGIMQSIADGTLDKDELVDRVHQLGLEYMEN